MAEGFFNKARALWNSLTAEAAVRPGAPDRFGPAVAAAEERFFEEDGREPTDGEIATMSSKSWSRRHGPENSEAYDVHYAALSVEKGRWILERGWYDNYVDYDTGEPDRQAFSWKGSAFAAWERQRRLEARHGGRFDFEASDAPAWLETEIDAAGGRFSVFAATPVHLALEEISGRGGLLVGGTLSDAFLTDPSGAEVGRALLTEQGIEVLRPGIAGVRVPYDSHRDAVGFLMDLLPAAEKAKAEKSWDADWRRISGWNEAAATMKAGNPGLSFMDRSAVVAAYVNARNSAGKLYSGIMEDLGASMDASKSIKDAARIKAKKHKDYPEYSKQRMLRDAGAILIEFERPAYKSLLRESHIAKEALDADIKAAYREVDREDEAKRRKELREAREKDEAARAAAKAAKADKEAKEAAAKQAGAKAGAAGPKAAPAPRAPARASAPARSTAPARAVAEDPLPKRAADGTLEKRWINVGVDPTAVHDDGSVFSGAATWQGRSILFSATGKARETMAGLLAEERAKGVGSDPLGVRFEVSGERGAEVFRIRFASKATPYQRKAAGGDER